MDKKHQLSSYEYSTFTGNSTIFSLIPGWLLSHLIHTQLSEANLLPINSKTKRLPLAVSTIMAWTNSIDKIPPQQHQQQPLAAVTYVGNFYTAAGGGTLNPKPVEEAEEDLDPLEWNDPNNHNNDEEDYSLELMNVVELDAEEIEALVKEEEEKEKALNKKTSAAGKTPVEKDTSSGNRKRSCREDQDDLQEEAPRKKQASASRQQAVAAADTPYTMMTFDRPRVSRRRKKSKSLPKRPMNAFSIFYHQERQKIVESMSESVSEDDIQKQVGKLWRGLPQSEMQRYERRADEDKNRYHHEMEAYHHHAAEHFGKARGSPKDDDDDDDDDDNDTTMARPGGEEGEEDHEEGENCYGFVDLPPPPPGVVVIPAKAKGGANEEAAADSKPASPETTATSASAATTVAKGNTSASTTGNSTPSEGSKPHWVYPPQAPPTAAAGLPSPIASAARPPPRGHSAQPSPSHPHAEMHHQYRIVSTGSSVSSHPRPVYASWPPHPASPYHSYPHPPPPGRDGMLPPAPPLAPTRSLSPDFGRVARPAYAAAPQQQQPPSPPSSYSIPPGMELALPSRYHGGEQKYRVTYKCYQMRREELPGFMQGMGATSATLIPPSHPSYPHHFFHRQQQQQQHPQSQHPLPPQYPPPPPPSSAAQGQQQPYYPHHPPQYLNGPNPSW